MDSIEINDKIKLFESTGAQALDDLLVQSVGYPKKPDEVKEKIFSSLCFPWRNYDSSVKSLGGSYWISKDALFDGTKLKPFAQSLLAEPKDAQSQQAQAWTKKLKCYYVHSENPNVIGLPRFWALSVFGMPKKDMRNQGHELLMRPTIDVRELQKQAIDQSLLQLETWGGCTIIADCGFGKTRLAIGLLTTLGRKTMVLCNREVLMLQWASVFEELAPGLKISWIQGSASLTKKKIRVSDGRVFLGPNEPSDICICSIETLIEGIPKEISTTFGTLIVDECHHLAAATLVHAVPMMPVRNVIGLSATPDRRDGLEHVLYWLLGPISFVYKRLPSITGVSGSVAIRRIQFKEGLQKEKYYMGGQMAYAEMLTFLSEDLNRNKLILDVLIGLLEEGRKKIILVSGLVDHCHKLKDALENSTLELKQPFKDKIAIMAGKSAESVKAKLPDTRIVLATYSLLEEGYDDPCLDTLILATPRSRIQQTVGRIERSHDGKLTPLVIDLVDSFSVYPAMFYKRKKFYTSRGFSIKNV